MATGLNNYTALGRLTRDPELHTASNGKPFTKFTLAIERAERPEVTRARTRGEEVDPKKATDYIQCSAWDRVAVYFCKYAARGALVGLQGSIQTSRYKNRNGQDVYSWEVVCRQLNLYEYKKKDVPMPDGEMESVNTGYVDPDDLPF